MSREISRADYYKAMLIYNTLINEMPAEYQEQFPVIDKFLSPANWTRSFQHDEIELSITGKRRFDALMGPHAKVLLMAYAAQRMDNAE
jgi:hypothetical protein